MVRKAVKPEKLLKRFKTFCVLDRHRISKERQRRRAITCSRRCQRLLTKLRKLERDRRVCDKCGRPSTPGERLEFRAFRLTQARGIHSRRLVSAKGIREPAKAIQTVADFADIAPEGQKKRR